MYGLCMPTGEVSLILKGGMEELIQISDLVNPRKEILEDKWIMKAINRHGYKNVEAIVYERYGKKTTVSIADYYAENGQELED